MKTGRRLLHELVTGLGSPSQFGWQSAVVRLLRYDLLVGHRTLALTFARWADRSLLIVAVGLVLLVGPPALTAASRTLSIGAMVAGAATGAYLAGRLAERLDWHGHHGVLADAALAPRANAAYSLCWLVPAAAVVALAAWWMGLPLAAVLLGMAVGAAVGWSLRPNRFRSADRRSARRAALLRRRLMASRSPVAGSMAAGLVLAVVWIGAATAVWPVAQRSAVATVLLGLAVALLVPIDNATLRLDALVGRPLSATFRSRTTAAVTASLIVVTGLALGGGWTAALLPGGVAALVLAVQSLRLILHRLYPERAAEWLTGATLSVAATLAVAAPPLLLIAAPLTALRLSRRADRDRWLLPG